MNSDRTPSRRRDDDLTRRALDLTLELVQRGGFAAVTVEGVAKDLGCGKTALYRRWPDKSAMIADAALKVFRLGEVPDTGSLAGDLLAHVMVNKANQAEHLSSAPGSRLGIPALFEPTVYPLVWEKLFRHRVAMGVEVIQRGIDRGEIASDVDAEALLDCLAGLVLYRQSIKGIEVTEAQLAAIIRGLISSPPRRSAASHPLTEGTGS
jgi:AcrR family transcriptional regulator